jgi:hypothetical protein
VSNAIGSDARILDLKRTARAGSNKPEGAERRFASRPDDWLFQAMAEELATIRENMAMRVIGNFM